MALEEVPKKLRFYFQEIETKTKTIILDLS